MSLISDVCEKQPLLDFLSPPDEKDTAIILERVLSDLHAGQLSFVNDTETEILGLCAGYGSGKTRSLLAKCLHLSLLNQGFTGIVLEPTQPLVRDLFVTEFEEFLLNYEIPYTFRSSPLPDFVLHLPKGDTRIMCRSFESWQRIIGINASFILADEIDTVAPSICQRAFPKILGRLRAGNVRQFAAASTPEGYRWFWETFGSDEAKEKNDRKLIRMKTTDNPHLPADFIDRMKMNYDPNLLKAYLEGQFISLTTGAVFDRFDREKHITKDIPNHSDEIIRLGIDFNIGKMSCVCAVIRDNKLYIFDEIRAHDTDQLAKAIRQKFPHNRLYGYPDSSGGARSTNATKTDIQILEGYSISNQSGASNPSIKDSVNNVQRLLCNGKEEISLFVHPRCKNVIESLELQSYTEAGEPEKTGLDHFSDCVRYLCWRCFNPLHLGAGRKTGIRIY